MSNFHFTPTTVTVIPVIKQGKRSPGGTAKGLWVVYDDEDLDKFWELQDRVIKACQKFSDPQATMTRIIRSMLVTFDKGKSDIMACAGLNEAAYGYLFLVRQKSQDPLYPLTWQEMSRDIMARPTYYWTLCDEKEKTENA